MKQLAKNIINYNNIQWCDGNILVLILSENGSGVTFNGETGTGHSPGLPLSLSTDPSSAGGPVPSGSTDASNLTLLQPANNGNVVDSVAAAAYTPPTLLPGFSTHYTTGEKTIIKFYKELRTKIL